MLIKNENGTNKTYYHGTTKVFDSSNNDVFWVSESPDLANQYAEFRDYEEKGGGIVKPVWIGTKQTFNADKLPNTVTIGPFLMELSRQYQEITGDRPDNQMMHGIKVALQKGRSIEESGPYYSPQDFWYQANYKFGNDASKLLMQLYQDLGFDSISFTEENNKTIGVLPNGTVINAISKKEMKSEKLFQSSDTSKVNLLKKIEAAISEEYSL